MMNYTPLLETTEIEQEDAINHIEQILKDFLNTSKVRSKEVPKNKKVVEKLIESLLQKMIFIDPLFEAMNPKQKPRGSVKDSLKVGKPNEFDYDVYLTLPVDDNDITVNYSESHPSWVECKVSNFGDSRDSFSLPVEKKTGRYALDSVLHTDQFPYPFKLADGDSPVMEVCERDGVWDIKTFTKEESLKFSFKLGEEFEHKIGENTVRTTIGTQEDNQFVVVQTTGEGKTNKFFYEFTKGYILLRMDVDVAGTPCYQKFKRIQWPLPRKCWRKSWKNLTDGEGRILRTGLRSWMQGLVNRAIKILAAEGDHGVHDWNKLHVSNSGPAVTLKLSEPSVSIDLVASLKIPEKCADSIASGLKRSGRVSIVTQNSLPDSKIVLYQNDLKKSFVVPADPRVPLNEKPSEPHFLRLSLPAVEEYLMKDQKSLKDVIRLLKILRDKNHWDPIASYFIIHLCLGANVNTETKGKLSQLFLLILFELKETLKSGYLPLTWEPNCNLFVKLTKSFRSSVSGRIGKSFKALHKIGISVTKDSVDTAKYEVSNIGSLKEIFSLLYVNKKNKK